MRGYQIVIKPVATATGEPGRWSFVAHGARYSKEEADAIEPRLKEHGYRVKRLAI